MDSEVVGGQTFVYLTNYPIYSWNRLYRKGTEYFVSL